MICGYLLEDGIVIHIAVDMNMNVANVLFRMQKGK